MGRVVFVEDDPTIRKLVQAALRSSPHEVHFATNGREGLELVLRIRPDAVFTDVSMPEMDGLQLADEIRAHPEIAKTPIVFITASVQKDQIDRYINMYVNRWSVDLGDEGIAAVRRLFEEGKKAGLCEAVQIEVA